MGTPDGLLLYCGLCIFIVVVFCCCFHVIELIKLGYLKKLTSPHRYSLSGISNAELFDNDSRSSTRRNTVVTSSETPTTTSGSGADGGNFSIITVFTYSPSSQSKKTQAQQKRFNDNVDLAARRQYLHETFTREFRPSSEIGETEEGLRIDSTTITLESDSCNSGDDNISEDENTFVRENFYDNISSKHLMDKPPNYDVLFPKMTQ